MSVEAVRGFSLSHHPWSKLVLGILKRSAQSNKLFVIMSQGLKLLFEVFLRPAFVIKVILRPLKLNSDVSITLLVGGLVGSLRRWTR